MSFKLKSVLAFMSVIIFYPTLAISQDDVKDVNELNLTLRTVYESLQGKEISIDGVIGTSFGDQIYFADITGSYKVSLDAGREVRRKIEGCEVNIFDREKSLCKISGMAEIKVENDDDNIADGIEIGLILYQVDSFEKREEQ